MKFDVSCTQVVCNYFCRNKHLRPVGAISLCDGMFPRSITIFTTKKWKLMRVCSGSCIIFVETTCVLWVKNYSGCLHICKTCIFSNVIDVKDLGGQSLCKPTGFGTYSWFKKEWFGIASCASISNGNYLLWMDGWKKYEIQPYARCNAVFANVCSKSMEWSVPMWYASLDLRKAFDRIDYNALFDALKLQGVPFPYLKLLAFCIMIRLDWY